jgi:hypothetical protein
MALCPNRHENPESLSTCRTCGLPLIDLTSELSLLNSSIKARSILARPRDWNFLIGVGTIGTGILKRARNLKIGQVVPRLTYLAVDTEKLGEAPALGAEPFFVLQIGSGAIGESTFCGRGELAAEQDPFLNPLIDNIGLREKDENQSILVALALGGGTASGATPVLLNQIRLQNPACFIFVLSILPSIEESMHARINAYYGLSRLIYSGHNSLADGVIAVRYDRLKKLRGVGETGGELNTEEMIQGLFRLMASAFTVPNVAKFGRLNRWMRTPVMTPCLALGRSLEIFGSLSNILESSIAYPLSTISKDNVVVSELILRIPKRLAKYFPDNLIAEELASFNRKHFSKIKSTIYQVSYTDEQHDRIDACVLMGANDISEAISDAKTAFDEFRLESKDSKQWEMYGLTKEKVTAAYEVMTSYRS